tara:strand:- start:596 stop:796 length:201 start_codon:yes stop_codon:yes gene_type:complete
VRWVGSLEEEAICPENGVLADILDLKPGEQRGADTDTGSIRGSVVDGAWLIAVPSFMLTQRIEQCV